MTESRQDAFFNILSASGLAVAYSDIRLKSGYSEKVPSEVTVAGQFSRRVPLKIPIVSAAMDTVTEHGMAIAMAQLGGLGVIHRNFTPEQQASEVAKVRRHMNGLIEQPVWVLDTDTVADILERRDREGLSFHSFPVVNNKGRLVGIVVHNDFDLCNDLSAPVSSIMGTNLVNAVHDTSLSLAAEIMRKTKRQVLPLTDETGALAGMYIYSDVKRIASANLDGCNLDEDGHLRVAAAIGTGADTAQRVELLAAEGVDAVVIDTAHADSKSVYAVLKDIKSNYPDLDVVVGNVSEADSAKRLLDAGADGIKIGQGPGSICTTRIIAGIGCPQATAVYECAKAVRGSGVPVCADGGITSSGDITIALSLGAQCVMLGKLLAGTDESPGETSIYQGSKVKFYRGMGSLGAMKASQGSRERYGQGASKKDKLVPEGIEGVVPYGGSLRDVMHQQVGGLRSGMGYVGAATVEELQEKADYYRITSAGLGESHPHDITITAEAPNYGR